MAGLGQRPHTESCRERMEEALEGDEEGRAILEAARERVAEYVEEKIKEDEQVRDHHQGQAWTSRGSSGSIRHHQVQL